MVLLFKIKNGSLNKFESLFPIFKLFVIDTLYGASCILQLPSYLISITRLSKLFFLILNSEKHSPKATWVVVRHHQKKNSNWKLSSIFHLIEEMSIKFMKKKNHKFHDFWSSLKPFEVNPQLHILDKMSAWLLWQFFFTNIVSFFSLWKKTFFFCQSFWPKRKQSIDALTYCLCLCLQVHGINDDIDIEYLVWFSLEKLWL